LHAGVQPQRFLRELFALSCRVTAAVFIQTIERALRYRITDIETLRRIARLSISQQEFQLSGVEVDESFRQREAYQQGHLTGWPAPAFPNCGGWKPFPLSANRSWIRNASCRCTTP